MWSLAGHDAIESRTIELIDEAESEIAFLVVDEDILSERLFDKLHTAAEQELSIVLGGQTEAITESLGMEFPNIRVFGTSLDWLTGPKHEDEVAISRILLVDRKTLLIGSYYPKADNTKEKEQAIFARGLENGIVVLLRRLLTSGLSARQDPSK